MKHFLIMETKKGQNTNNIPILTNLTLHCNLPCDTKLHNYGMVCDYNYLLTQDNCVKLLFFCMHNKTRIDSCRCPKYSYLGAW